MMSIPPYDRPAHFLEMVEADRKQEVQAAEVAEIHGIDGARQGLALQDAPEKRFRRRACPCRAHAENPVETTPCREPGDFRRLASGVLGGEAGGETLDRLVQAPTGRPRHDRLRPHQPRRQRSDIPDSSDTTGALV